jgi:hypothetical protein
MNKQTARLKRPRHPMPEFVRNLTEQLLAFLAEEK